MRVSTYICFILPLFFTLISCNNNSTTIETPTPTIKPFEVNFVPETTFQSISGFGGANRMWGTMSLKPQEAIKAFGLADNQLGLSIFRVRLSSNSSEWSNIIEAVKEANKLGVTVLASPWSPPAKLKNNNSDIGGYLLPENYKAFKDHINAYIEFMKQNGAQIDVVSIQNEPDIKVTYESCDWTSDQMIDFFKAPGQIVGAKVAAPESFNFNPNFTNALLQNQDVVSKIDIVAGHIYGSGLGEFPLATQSKKEVWMTEYLMNLNVGNTGSAKWITLSESAKWNESLKMLGTVHDAMQNNWNAYIWWYLQRFYSFIGDGEEGTTSGEILKRGYAFSHFSKFIRPGSIRIKAELPSTSKLKTTAYKKENQIVMVIINMEETAVKRFQIKNDLINNANSYTTTENANMVKKSLTITDKTIEIDIPPQSVTTLVLNN